MTLIPYLYLLMGFFVHILRDHDRQSAFPLMFYIKNNSRQITLSLLMCLIAASVYDITNELESATALAIGYSSDSLFRFIIAKNNTW